MGRWWGGFAQEGPPRRQHGLQLACIDRVSRTGLSPCRIHDHAVQDIMLACREEIQTGAFQDAAQDDSARNDNGGAAGLEPHDLAPLRVIQGRKLP